ncbi:hypothetical protein AgCh_000712 [Apium graveolens]
MMTREERRPPAIFRSLGCLGGLRQWTRLTCKTKEAETHGLLRAYLLFLIGTLLFLENHKTDIFVGYLLFLKDLTPDVVNGFAWEAAVLAKMQSAFLKKSNAIGAMWIVENEKRGYADWNYVEKYKREIEFYNDNRYASVVRGIGG